MRVGVALGTSPVSGHRCSLACSMPPGAAGIGVHHAVGLVGEVNRIEAEIESGAGGEGTSAKCWAEYGLPVTVEGRLKLTRSPS